MSNKLSRSFTSRHSSQAIECWASHSQAKKLMTTATLAKWTVQEYHQMIEAGILAERRVELIAGDIVEVSPEKPLHAHIGRELNYYLQSLLGQRAKVSEAHPVTLSDSEPEPDIAVVRWQTYRERHPHAEDIYFLIEVADTTLAKDLDDKKKVYARAGIVEYWVIDVQGRKVKVFRQPEGNSYASETEFSQGSISPIAFPDVSLEVRRIFS